MSDQRGSRTPPKKVLTARGSALAAKAQERRDRFAGKNARAAAQETRTPTRTPARTPTRTPPRPLA